MFNIGPQELLILLVVALVIVGPKRLPELGRTLGRGLNEFRKLQDEVKDMVKFDLNEDPVFPSDRSYDDPGTQDEDDDDDDAPGPGDELADERSHSERVIAAMQDDAEQEPEPLPEVAAATNDAESESGSAPPHRTEPEPSADDAPE